MGVSGSPPRVWGIPADRANGGPAARFTPTRVGNTKRCVCVCIKSPVHPHACGEYYCRTPPAVTVHGSPPRVWGIQGADPACTGDHRFTPTRVGNTFRRWRPTPARTVHPHACGEYACLNRLITLLSGSPPRVWGIRAKPFTPPLPVRFTPTRVGNTERVGCNFFAPTVHPHACGEYCPIDKKFAGINGSPPRVWGILAMAQ